MRAAALRFSPHLYFRVRCDGSPRRRAFLQRLFFSTPRVETGQNACAGFGSHLRGDARFCCAHRRNCILRLLCSAADIDVNLWLPEADLRGKSAASQYLPEMRQEGRIAIPAEITLLRALFQHVTNSGCRNRRLRLHRRKKEPRAKRQKLSAVCTGTLWKQQNGHRRRKALRYLRRYAIRAAAAAAIEKDRASGASGPPKERPALHFNLGNKKARHRRRQNHDVEIAEMVGDDQPLGRNSSFHSGVNPKAGEHAARCRLQPQRALLQRKRATHADQPEAKRTRRKSESQRDRPPEAAEDQCVSGARNRLRAAAESDLRSSNVKKSIVRNSRSHAGGAAMRAPMARYVLSSLGTLTAAGAVAAVSCEKSGSAIESCFSSGQE